MKWLFLAHEPFLFPMQLVNLRYLPCAGDSLVFVLLSIIQHYLTLMVLGKPFLFMLYWSMGLNSSISVISLTLRGPITWCDNLGGACNHSFLNCVNKAIWLAEKRFPGSRYFSSGPLWKMWTKRQNESSVRFKCVTFFLEKAKKM